MAVMMAQAQTTLQEQLAKIDRICKEQELLRYLGAISDLTREQIDRYQLLSKILSVEY